MGPPVRPPAETGFEKSQRSKALSRYEEGKDGQTKPWFIVEGNDKKRARPNCIDHLLSQIPYEDVLEEAVSLPQRVFDPHYEQKVLPPELYVPQKY